MPNAINPNDYNIDKINTGFLGPILTTDFRNYVLGFNLEEINPEVVSHGYNLGGLGEYVGDNHNPIVNVQDLPDVYGLSDTPIGLLGNSTPWESNQVMNLWGMSDPYSYQIGNNTIQTTPPVQNKMAYTVQPTVTLSDPGNTTLWKKNDGSQETAKNVREKMINSRLQFSENSYGPDYLYAYNCPDVPPEQTGFIQYKTFAGGDFRSTILGQQLGFGAGAGIEFDSNLADIGKEQRAFNIKERIKLNFIGDTVGKINADPLGLLAGQDLFTRDYTITQAPGFGGKAFEFTQSLLGFNIPTSILPSWKSVGGIDGDDVNQDLLNNTAEGTKSLLYDAIVKNKWGPRFMHSDLLPEPNTKVGKFFKNLNDKLDTFNGAGEQPATIRYTDEVKTDVEAQEDRDKPLVDKLNSKIAETVDKIKRKVNPSVLPIESEKPTPEEDPTVGGKNLGYNIGFQDTTWQDEYEIDNQFNDSPNTAKQYNNRFKATQYTEEPELTSDKNNLFWKAGNPNKAKRGLLKFTQNLINGNSEPFGKDSSSSARFIGITNSDSNVNPSKGNKHKLFSQGNRVTVGQGDDKVYCRSWSVRNPYSKYEDTLRHEKLRRDAIFQDLSVLESNGMPKIVPYAGDIETVQGLHVDKKPSRYMLSIENLAWQNTREFNALMNCEKGPHGGRIMWFPPYDINFTDNSSVNWESTQFIGRGEPIYTYNNTERTGTLSFTIITDHPSSLNALRNQTKASLERYFAGCEDLSVTAFGDVDAEEVPEPAYAEPPQPVEAAPPSSLKLTYYFQNADTTPKNAPGRSVDTDIAANYECLPLPTVPPSCVGKNSNFLTELDAMANFLLTPQGKRYKIVSEGFASSLNVNDYNKTLSEDRANSLRNYLLNYLTSIEDTPVKVENVPSSSGDKYYPTEQKWKDDPKRWPPGTGRGEVPGSGPEEFEPPQTPEAREDLINNPKAVNARKATIRLVPNGDIDAEIIDKETNEIERVNKEKKAEFNRKQTERQNAIDEASQKLANMMVNECTYFNKLEVENSFVYDSLKEKIQYFHPAFHSMTPEGLNSRLTFLKQCTRQGPNINRGEPQNVAFGKPPICVLRIGDFYHTKIVIDTVNFTYEPLIWDLNPEGIGVQPMITKVDLNFKFIGGSSLGGPITELQNAVSFNFFANTSVYNRRKSVTVKSEKDLPGRKGTKKETFQYGSFISPNQKEYKIPDVEIDLDKGEFVTETDIIKNQEWVTGIPQDKKGLEDKNKIDTAIEENGSFEEAAKDASEVIEVITSDGQIGQNTVIKSVTYKIKDEEKDNWNILFFEMDINNPCEEGDGITGFPISSDQKSVSYTLLEEDILDCNESANYTYKFYITVQSTGDDDKVEEIIIKELTNEFKK